MRIYICGAHSCGKTTLAHYIADKYKIPMITEVARQVLSENEYNLSSLRTNLDIVDSYQEQVFYRQLSEEKKYAEFVSDRSFDNLAYAAQHSRILKKLLDSKELREYIASLRENNVVIFFVRPSKVTLKADGVRESLNWDGIVAIDAMVKFLLEMFELPYYQINMDNMQERSRMIDSVLQIKRSA